MDSSRKILACRRGEAKILRHTDEVMYAEKFLRSRNPSQNLAAEGHFVIQGRISKTGKMGETGKTGENLNTVNCKALQFTVSVKNDKKKRIEKKE